MREGVFFLCQKVPFSMWTSHSCHSLQLWCLLVYCMTLHCFPSLEWEQPISPDSSSYEAIVKGPTPLCLRHCALKSDTACSKLLYKSCWNHTCLGECHFSIVLIELLPQLTHACWLLRSPGCNSHDKRDLICLISTHQAGMEITEKLCLSLGKVSKNTTSDVGFPTSLLIQLCMTLLFLIHNLT